MTARGDRRRERWRSATILAFGVALVAAACGLTVLGNLAVSNRHKIEAQTAHIGRLEGQVRALGGTPIPADEPPTTTTTTTSAPAGRRAPTSGRTTTPPSRPEIAPRSPSSTSVPPTSAQPQPTPTGSTTTTTARPPEPPPAVCIRIPPLTVC